MFDELFLVNTENSIGLKNYVIPQEPVIKNSVWKEPISSSWLCELQSGRVGGAFSEGFSDTAICIRVKIAARFTELSAVLMLHHGLLFHYVSEAV